MPDQNFNQLLTEAVDRVLETMFFTAPLGAAEPETGATVIEARLAFHGRLSGSLSVCLSEPSVRLLAAGFLGEDEETLTDAQSGQVICELANMLCGSLVSKLESEKSFDLAPPELGPFESETAAGSDAPPAARQSYQVEGGILTVTFHLKAPA
jgi:CheY-specific phosphatase CheX